MSPRIVSLIPSATEIAAALGFADQLVGRSHECDFPPQVSRLPACSSARLDINASSGEIDRRVKDVLRNAVSVYDVHTDVLEQLAPDFILTQTQCELCAVSLKDVQQAVCELYSSEPEIVALEPMCLADVWDDILRVATALDCRTRGEQLVQQLQQRLDQLKQQTEHLPDRPTLCCIEWTDPLMAAGNWIPELVELAGGRNLFGTAGEHSSWLDWPAIQQADPDVIAIMPCGFDLPRSRREMAPVISLPGWADLRAVREQRVFVTDGNQYFNRPGPRLVESAEILSQVLHPDLFAPEHHGTGWQRL
ncbi:MAG: cobalamin-binding protein [Planctomycetaceae bacterium]|nr:cobalamin-binding protein [Planctomycetaceae bacterium]